MYLHKVRNSVTSFTGVHRPSPEGAVDSRYGGGLDHALQGDLTDSPLPATWLSLARGPCSVAAGAPGRSTGACSSAAGLRTSACLLGVVVNLQRRQHGRLASEYDVVRRHAADVSQAVAREDRVGQQGVEASYDPLPAHLLLCRVQGVPEDGATALDETSVLPRRPDVHLHSSPLHLLLKVGRGKAAFAVHDQHLHGPEELDP